MTDKPSEARSKCQHKNHSCEVDINHIEDVGRWQADVRIKCADCGLPFRFIGLPAGLGLNGAAVSVDATEARLAIAPKGEVLSEIEGTPIGFTVRKNS